MLLLLYHIYIVFVMQECLSSPIHHNLFYYFGCIRHNAAVIINTNKNRPVPTADIFDSADINFALTRFSPFRRELILFSLIRFMA